VTQSGLPFSARIEMDKTVVGFSQAIVKEGRKNCKI
jgi:hypothetical protein